jgi:hypothetical protein
MCLLIPPEARYPQVSTEHATDGDVPSEHPPPAGEEPHDEQVAPLVSAGRGDARGRDLD